METKNFSLIFLIAFTLGIGFTISLMQTVTKPAISKQVKRLIILHDRGFLVTIDSRCHYWMWDDKAKVSYEITNKLDELIPVAEAVDLSTTEKK